MGKALAPYAPITRDDSLYSTVQNMTSKLCIFLLLYFLYIFPFYVFLLFGVDKGVAFALMYPQVR